MAAIHALPAPHHGSRNLVLLVSVWFSNNLSPTPLFPLCVDSSCRTFLSLRHICKIIRTSQPFPLLCLLLEVLFPSIPDWLISSVPRGQIQCSVLGDAFLECTIQNRGGFASLPCFTFITALTVNLNDGIYNMWGGRHSTCQSMFVNSSINWGWHPTCWGDFITKSKGENTLYPSGICSNSIQSHSERRAFLEDFFFIQAFNKQSSQSPQRKWLPFPG